MRSTLPRRALLAGVGAILGSRAARASELDVRSFGAIGDGRADDAPAIQRALDVGGRVVIPPGRFRLASAPLRYDGATTLIIRGELIHDTDIEGREIHAFHSRTFGSPARISDVVIRFEGGALTLTPSRFGGTKKGLSITNVDGFELEGVRIRGEGFGSFSLTVQDASRGLIRGGRITAGDRVGEDGLHFYGRCSDILVSDLFVESGDDALSLTCEAPDAYAAVLENIRIENCIFKSARHSGLKILLAEGAGPATIRNISIENCGFSIFRGPAGQTCVIRNLARAVGASIRSIQIAHCDFDFGASTTLAPNLWLSDVEDIAFDNLSVRDAGLQLFLAERSERVRIHGSAFEYAAAPTSARVRQAPDAARQAFAVDLVDCRDCSVEDIVVRRPRAAALSARISRAGAVRPARMRLQGLDIYGQRFGAGVVLAGVSGCSLEGIRMHDAPVNLLREAPTGVNRVAP